MIRFSKPFNQISSYVMSVVFTQQQSNAIYTCMANIYVVIKRPSAALTPPRFLQSSYEFSISENLQPGDIARSVKIVAYETDELSLYTSGFFLSLLNPDYSYVTGLFEVTPKYGEGTLVASLRLNTQSKLDHDNGLRSFKYIVSAAFIRSL